MLKKDKIPDISIFFILLSDGNTQYFTVKKTKEIFKIYWNDFIKVCEEGAQVPEANSIEFTENGFVLKNAVGETICSLEDYYKIKNKNNKQPSSNLPKIELLYIDSQLRKELLTREQLRCDEVASRIPGILYEPIQEKLGINTNEFFNEEVEEEFLFDEEPLFGESTNEEEPIERTSYTRTKHLSHPMYIASRV